MPIIKMLIVSKVEKYVLHDLNLVDKFYALTVYIRFRCRSMLYDINIAVARSMNIFVFLISHTFNNT